MIIKLLLVLIFNLNCCSSFFYSAKPIPIRKYYRNFRIENKGLPIEKKLPEILVHEPLFNSKKNTTAIIFFTGGSSFITSDIYTNFMHNLAYHNFAIYTPFLKYSDKNYLIDRLSKDYRGVMVMGHSSGCTTAINFCRQNKIVKKLVLLDGVNTGFLTGKNKFEINHIDQILMLNAGKAYKWTFDPPGIPFIPFFSISKNNLICNQNCITKKITAENYGHCDILDVPYSNLMHNTRLSVGFKNRSKYNNIRYHQWLASVINYFKINQLKLIRDI